VPRTRTPSKPPKSSKLPLQKQLEPLREAIDDLDNQIINLLNRRAHVAQQIGVLKAKLKQRAYVPERETQVLDRLVARSRGPLSGETLRLIYKEIISASLALESPLQVAFLGPEATFTHAAALRHFGSSAHLRPCATIAEVFTEVTRRRSEYGVVPFESSSEGLVHHTLDNFLDADLVICTELMLPTTHHLLSNTPDIKRITRIYGAPGALQACRTWLEAHMAYAAILDLPTTAQAVQLASEESGAAVVASAIAAKVYSLPVVARDLQERTGDFTRFLVIGHDEPAPTGQDRTSIMFALRDAPGVLHTTLRHLVGHDINMLRIESRPVRHRLWDYLFFIDLEGHRADVNVAAGLEKLAKTCVFLKVLGSYPRVTAPPRRRIYAPSR
jgi:chorismate mutase / prephenate dehydratase